ncbi:hypothetical protein CTheo_7632 [Ceratobasidium theobromae]|uniref:F-box domain-containing protein n=1 Tax=Ceratobasidium theobromae TaxID=1582974 RepID=A0A5N5QBA5_9AGAM|nr:hypothetical protein CTheo_7632 [Ceratobasidium theobromae]
MADLRLIRSSANGLGWLQLFHHQSGLLRNTPTNTLPQIHRMASLTKALAAIKKRETPNSKSAGVAEWLETYNKTLKRYECFPRLEVEDSSSDDEVSKTGVKPSSGPAQVCTTRRSRTVVDFPLDVFHEIVSYLAVADILSLSKTCKPFCRMLMSVSSKRLWQTALYRIDGLPPCPDILSEPQYASLILKYMFGFAMSAKPKYSTATELRRAGVHEFVPATEGKEMFDPPAKSIVVVLKRDVHTLVDEIKAIGAPISSPKIEQWRAHKTKAINACREFTGELVKYIQKTESDWLDEVRTIRRIREKEIQQRLRKDGWTSHDMQFPRETSALWDRLIQKPKILTDDANRGHVEKLAWEERSTRRHQCFIQTLEGTYKGEFRPLSNRTFDHQTLNKRSDGGNCTAPIEEDPNARHQH